MNCIRVVPVLLVLACAQPPAETPAGGGANVMPPAITGSEEQDMATRDRLRAEARQMARSDGCAEAGQCRAKPMGAKPCGGPWEYLVYCSLTTDEKALDAHLERLRQFEDTLNAHYRIGSICDMVMEPGVALESGSCRAAPR
jgi:hypothetical protein